MKIEGEVMAEAKDSQEKTGLFPNTTNIVVFRDKIYKVLRSSYRHTEEWYVYEYFSAPENMDGDLKKFKYVINSKEKTVRGWGCEQVAISYDAFASEAKLIEESAIPTYLHECLMNIQQRKLVACVPYKKIVEHELHHLNALRCEIENHVNMMMDHIYEVLEKSKTPLESIEYRFLAYENRIRNGCKIYYNYANADGKMRPRFQEYFTYLFMKLYPKPDTEAAAEIIDDDTWIQSTIWELLQKKYPFMTIDYVGAPTYIVIRLPTVNILH